MARSKSSNKWLQEHFADDFVKKAQQEGFRSRASFKLLEICTKDNLIKPAHKVLDLGAAPGGWSQVAVKLVGNKGQVVASDILPMNPIAQVQFVQGDFTQDQAYQQLLTISKHNLGFDVVLSDVAPNLSGIKASDQSRAMYLCELAQDLAVQVLKPGGSFLVKIFQGEGLTEYLQTMRKFFHKVTVRKPLASRSRSAEQYLLAQGFQNQK